MPVALVENANTSNIIAVVGEGNYRYTLPDGSQVSPVEAGWIGEFYRFCPVNPDVPIPTYIWAVTVGSNAGIGYTNGNILTVSGGQGNAAQAQVSSIEANGLVSSMLITNSGYYTSNPPSENTLTGGTGSGLSVELGMSEYEVESQSYTYNTANNTVTETNTYKIPVIDNTKSLEKQRQRTLQNDPNRTALLDKIHNASAKQIDNWLQNNVTNLAEARAVLGSIIKFLAQVYPYSGR